MTDHSAYPADRLIQIMARLRGADGCPWDRKQTSSSLKPYVIEEAYEVVEAIDGGEYSKLCEELGDLLLQIAFHCQIASERGEFNFNDVVDAICEKLIRRHPHVFADVEANDAGAVLRNWERIKQKEKEKESGSGGPASILDGVPGYLPALMQATKMQDKASRVGFDWRHAEDAASKVWEETEEFREALASGQRDRIQDEMGDVLFAVVNVARLLDMDAEETLRRANSRFVNRFRYIERRADDEGVRLEDMTLEEMDAVWDEAKKTGL
ncbi:MAG TPA: nucleoside triphosphate pyrophosphohydrolase [Firmicutes bacterium]|jgi:tetrapyrrole methylase family protein/MazG family protein|nr:nucleoside triphosphate pyrophosphohydrolase [Bacillota bacterium]